MYIVCTCEHSGACVHNIYIYVCVCICIYIYSMWMYVCNCIFNIIHVYIYIYVYIYVHICMYINREREQTKVYLQYAFISIYLLVHTQKKNSASGVAFPRRCRIWWVTMSLLQCPKGGQRFLRALAGCSSEYWTTSRCQYLAIQGYSAGFLTTAKVVFLSPIWKCCRYICDIIYMANYSKICIYMANYGNMVYLGKITPIVDDESYPQM